MTHPNLEEIDAYIQEKRSPVDAIAFFNFYESKGWLIGKAPMKNWKAAIVTWEQREKQRIVGNKPIQCRKCMDCGTLPDHSLCTCPRGLEAKQARIVMARIKATVKQMEMPLDTKKELAKQTAFLLEPEKKAEYAPTQDFEARRQMLRQQLDQVRK